MLFLESTRDQLLQPLLAASGVVEKRQTMPILANVLLERDTGNASALMALRDVPMFDNATLADGFASAMAQVGTRTQSAQFAAELSSSIAANLERDRTAVSGVNLDEEAARLIQYQQAYQASAKMIQIAQNIFDTLIQGLGR